MAVEQATILHAQSNTFNPVFFACVPGKKYRQTMVLQ
jgi:hypothetical protein